jgi:diguanylate cyclase (GGDEF)-like protein
VLIIDIDNFKEFNDNYGHLEGDRCLIKVAKCIMESLARPLDLGFRYGGEEFVVLLPNTNTEGAKLIGERIRRNIENLKMEHSFSKIAEVVTVSVGVNTTIPDYKFHFHEFVEKADKALYKAKSEGKNRVESI